MTNTNTLPCIICLKPLESAVTPEFEHNQPSEGLAFHTSGHYGCTVFDPMVNHMTLEINICDPCLVSRASAFPGSVVQVVQIPTPDEYKYTAWSRDPASTSDTNDEGHPHT